MATREITTSEDTQLYEDNDGDVWVGGNCMEAIIITQKELDETIKFLTEAKKAKQEKKVD